MLSIGGIKSFVFARQASPRREFIARLAVQKKNFYPPETQHGRRVTKFYSTKKEPALVRCGRMHACQIANLVFNILSVILTAGVKFSSVHCSHCPEELFDD